MSLTEGTARINVAEGLSKMTLDVIGLAGDTAFRPFFILYAWAR